MVSVLEDAIRSRRVVTFHYDGPPRIVEPFLIGTTTAGRPALRGFQTGGGIAMIQESFSGERPWYNPADKAMSTIGPHV